MLRVVNETLLNAADASVNQNSPALGLENMLGYSIQVVFTGTAAGTLSLQGSDDFYPDASFGLTTFQPTNWTVITGSSTAITSPMNVLYNTANSYYRWVRVVYVATSGTGTISAQANAKGF